MNIDNDTLYVICESACASSYWCTMTNLGIHDQANKKGISVETIDITAAKNIIHKHSEQIKNNPFILSGASLPWINEALSLVCRGGFKCIVIGVDNHLISGRNVSVVSVNHEDATIDIVQYLMASKRDRIAFFACNPRSPTDANKKKAIKKACSDFELAFTDNDVFEIQGSLSECLRDFGDKMHLYNGIICSNDASAVALIRYSIAAGLRIPQDAYVVGFGNTLIGQLVSPSITSSSLDYYDVGKKAVDIYLYLRRHPSVSYQSTVVNCQLYPRESTEYRNPGAYISDYGYNYAETNREKTFYGDTTVSGLLDLELFLQNLDPVDFFVLDGLISGKPYSILVEEYSVSESTVKYRLRKMLMLLGCTTRAELLAIIDKNIGPVLPGTFRSCANHLFPNT